MRKLDAPPSSNDPPSFSPISGLLLRGDARTPLGIRAQVDLERPRILRLMNQMYDLIANALGRDEPRRIDVRHRLAHAIAVDRAIDVEHRAMHAEMAILIRERFCQRALRQLRSGV